MKRPATSKARGQCRYYTTPRGCFSGDRCKFVHGDPAAEPALLTPYDMAKRCRDYANGFCRRGEECWFLHVDPARSSTEDDGCSICLETPTTYGLLAGCSHVFCINCIRQWREAGDKPRSVIESGNTKKCPLCRAPSNYITPSSQFFRDGEEGKDKVIKLYRESLARIPCRYFQASMIKEKKPLCPFGKDCFYQHMNSDGTPYVFRDGVDKCMQIYAMRHRFGHPYLSSFTVELSTIPFPVSVSRSDPSSSATATGGQMRESEFDDFDLIFSRGLGQRREQRRNWMRRERRSWNQLNAVFERPTYEGLEMTLEAMRTRLGMLAVGGGAGSGDNADTEEGPGVWNLERGEEGEEGEEEEEEEQGEESGIWEDWYRGFRAANRGGDEAVMDELETLADHMLASLDAMRSGGETPPPPLEPAESSRSGDGSESGDEGMPALLSVSGSSDEEEDSDDDEMSLDGEPRRQAERDSVETAARDGCDNETSSGSSMVIGDDEESMRPTPVKEPPFVTDGRGRVVWSRGEEDGGEEETSSSNM